MASNVIRLDKASLVDHRLRQGLFLIDDGVDRSDCEYIPRLTHISGDDFIDSTDQCVKSIPILKDITNKGDVVVSLNGGKDLRTYLTSKSSTNTLLVTEACENRCVFCSQPPKQSSSFYKLAWLGVQNFRSDGVIGVSGGEPTLYWDDFIDFSRRCSNQTTNKYFHVLTHGRNFESAQRIQELADTGFLSKSLWGIPVHGHTSALHDTATGIQGSFLETLNGLIHLSFLNAAIELRVIVTRQNCNQLRHIANLIATYLGGANVFVAFMNLEPIGWAKAHYKHLSVEPHVYADHLSDALDALEARNVEARLYNFPICSLPSQLQGKAHKSISDWKNYFPDACKGCKVKNDCCGFFTSAEGVRLPTPKPLL